MNLRASVWFHYFVTIFGAWTMGTFFSPCLRAENYDLATLIHRAENHQAIVKDNEALRRFAANKLDEVNSKKWLPTFEMKVYGGVVPDATVDKNNVNDYKSNSFESGFSFDDIGPFVKAEVELVQPIFTFGKISNYTQMANKATELAEQEKRKKLADIRQLVKKAYYTLQLVEDSISILKDVQEKLRAAAEKVEEQLIKNADNVSETDRLKIKVFVADVENRLLDAERGRKLSREALEELGQIAGDWSLDQPSLASEEMIEISKEDLVSAAMRAKPELNQLQEMIDLKEAERRVARADLFPTIFIAGKLDYGKAPGRTDVQNPYLNDPFNNFDVGAVLGLKQDLGFWRALTKMEGVQAEIDRLSAQKIQLSIKTKLDAGKAYEEALSSAKAIRVNEEGFRAARSWLASEAIAFNLGTAETKSVLESYAAYFKAKFDLMKSIYNLDVALTDLSVIGGIEVLKRLQPAVAPKPAKAP